MIRLDWLNVIVESGVVRQILRVGCELALDPVDGSLIIVDILGVVVAQPRFSISVPTEPLVGSVVVLCLVTTVDVRVEVRAVLKLSVHTTTEMLERT